MTFTKPPARASFAVAFLIVLGALAVTFYVLSMRATDTILVQVLTAWFNLLTFVAGYYFGNSQGADRKSELLAQSSPGQTVDVKAGTATVQTPPAQP